jgi:hypothetical protein
MVGKEVLAPKLRQSNRNDLGREEDLNWEGIVRCRPTTQWIGMGMKRRLSRTVGRKGEDEKGAGGERSRGRSRRK